MTLFSDTHETLPLFDGYVEEVQHVFRDNHVHFGTPFDLPTAAQALENNSKLRQDLRSLTQSFMGTDKNVSLRSALSIIAIAIGGPQLATSDDDISRAVKSLVDFLISVDGCAANSPKHPDSLCSDLIDDEIRQAHLSPVTSDHETHSDQLLEAGNLNAPETVDLRSDQYPPFHPDGENSFAESLTRLELNSLQVKHYLDSIDQRISRMEPRLDSLPTYMPPPSTPHSGQAPDERYSATLATETLPHQPQNEPSSPDPYQAQTSLPAEMQSLLRSSSQQILSQNKFEIPVITGLTVIVLLLLVSWGFDQYKALATTHQMAAPVAENLTSAPSTIAPARYLNSSRPPASTAALQPRSNVASDGDLSRRTEGPSSNSPTPLRPSSMSSSAAITDLPTNSALESTPTNLLKPSAALPAGTEKSSYRPEAPTRLINVSSGVMAANVLSAPQPSYPKLASLTHMQGEVVMQAIISKRGRIENVRVIKGHRLLRGAATNAVRSWRYRPYLVDGRPVQVATIVSVDFKLVR